MESHYWLDQMTACLDDARNKHINLNKKEAVDFTVFRYITADENGLSRIIADLLDVKGAHGQHTLFLSSFLKLIGKETWEASAFKFIQCEQQTDALNSKRRIDIVVQGERWTLAIENKPSAADQPMQITDYLDELKKRRNALNETLLIYLTPNGTRPSLFSITEQDYDAAIQSGELINLSYHHLVTWLDGLCENNTIAYRVRVFLADLRRFISVNILNCREDNIVDVLLEKIFEDASTLDTTLSLISLKSTIYHTLIKKMTGELTPPPGWQICQTLQPDCRIGLRPPEAKGWYYCIEPTNERYQFWYYGIKLDNDLNLTESASLAAQQLKIDFPSGARSSAWWPWWRRFNGYLPHDLDPVEYSDWSTNNRAWLDMSNGEFAKRCIALFIKLHESVINGNVSSL